MSTGRVSAILDFEEQIRVALADLSDRGLLRSPRTVRGAHGAELELDGRRVLGFCSNNYLGLADDPRIAAAAIRALGTVGAGAGASRHISGTNTLHLELEQRLARFVGLPRALFFATGYAANVGTVPALVGAGDAIFSDRLNHASLIDGARLSGAQIFIYDHCNINHLEDLLRLHRGRFRTALVISESLFSMDGDEAPLPGLRSLSNAFSAGLLLDEAHALGVLGPAGRGCAQSTAIKPDLLVGTLGKAVATAGAFVAGATDTLSLIENRARSYVFSTAPMPAQAAASIAALELVEHADERRTRVLSHAKQLREGLQQLGYRAPDGPGAIIPVLVGSAHDTMRLSAALLERRVFVHGIRPPTVPEGTSRLRLTPMATHTEAQLEEALGAFAALQEYLE